MSWLLELIAGPIIKALFKGFEWYLTKYEKDEQSRRDYLAFVETMKRKGQSRVAMKIASENQIDRLKKMWGIDN